VRTTAVRPRACALTRKPPAGEVSDYAVLLSIKLNDGPGFERNFAQARRWHTAMGESPSAGERRLLITGLHLMYLLVEGRLGEFAMRVETLSASDAASPPVTLALSQAEAVSFGKVVSSLSAPLPPALALFAPLCSRLAGAARDSFADAASVAYRTLTVPDAVALLALPSPAALDAYIAARGLAWTVRGGVVTLTTGGKPKAALDAEGTMSSLLAYATDVERIV